MQILENAIAYIKYLESLVGVNPNECPLTPESVYSARSLSPPPISLSQSIKSKSAADIVNLLN